MARIQLGSIEPIIRDNSAFQKLENNLLIGRTTRRTASRAEALFAKIAELEKTSSPSSDLYPLKELAGRVTQGVIKATVKTGFFHYVDRICSAIKNFFTSFQGVSSSYLLLRSLDPSRTIEMLDDIMGLREQGYPRGSVSLRDCGALIEDLEKTFFTTDSKELKKLQERGFEGSTLIDIQGKLTLLRHFRDTLISTGQDVRSNELANLPEQLKFAAVKSILTDSSSAFGKANSNTRLKWVLEKANPDTKIQVGNYIDNFIRSSLRSLPVEVADLAVRRDPTISLTPFNFLRLSQFCGEDKGRDVREAILNEFVEKLDQRGLITVLSSPGILCDWAKDYGYKDPDVARNDFMARLVQKICTQDFVGNNAIHFLLMVSGLKEPQASLFNKELIKYPATEEQVDALKKAAITIKKDYEELRHPSNRDSTVLPDLLMKLGDWRVQDQGDRLVKEAIQPQEKR